MTKKERVREILRIFDEQYPSQTKCYLDYGTDWQLLMATMLSAQCTDDRVNMVTPGLFRKYPELAALAGAELLDVEQEVKSTGFYHHKAKNMILAARMILRDFGGQLPSDMDKLTSLPGVGRKTANVVRSHIFNLPSIVVDTHVKRISGRLGLTESSDPEKIEYDLMKILPEEHWIRYNTQVIAHGRGICRARKPQCEICCFGGLCRAGMIGE